MAKQYPQARIKDWRPRLRRIQQRRAKGYKLQAAIALEGIARSTYWEWCQRAKRLEET